MPLKLKTVEADGKTFAEVKDGKPVYVDDTDNKEIAYDVPQNVAKILELNAENKKHRERADAAETKLKTFDGIEDPAAAIAAIQKLKDVDDGKLIQAGKVEEIRQAAQRAAEERVAAANKQNAIDLEKATKTAETLQEQLYSEKIGGGFARSKFIAENVAIPPDILQAQFGKNFKVEDGKIVAYYNDGQKVFSRAKPGSDPDFDEAVELLIDAYPNKEYILKGKGGGSGGRPGSGGGGRQGDKVITRQEFDALNPIDRSKKMGEGFKVVDAA